MLFRSNDAREADFGYQRVPWGEKKARVRGVFDSVANKYDVMNDLMSMGLHRAWKFYTVMVADLKPGRRRVAGLVNSVRFLKSRRGRMAVVTLDDGTARVEATVYNEVLESSLDKVIEDRIVIIEGECKVDDVSGEHALIVGEAGEWLVKDLNSRNGTIVNGTPVKARRLQHGDLIEVGIYRIVQRIGRDLVCLVPHIHHGVGWDL